jgi:hypothetical protein
MMLYFILLPPLHLCLYNPNINLLFVRTLLKLIYPSPLILSVEKVPLPPHALLVLMVVRVLPPSVISTNVYENSHFRASYPSSLIEGATYKVQRTGSTITYLVNDVVFHTSATTSSVPLHMDTA